ncbi:flagellar protein FliT [Massilia oculi]|uniref:Flagellar protein FliT n=1 Tax=Massilia hydrophila TaxID=3044279 RepID=A0ABS7Y4U6_9BURK|nr:flagellar protein FliT [Massilia oculi]MCA1854681.1 flagellar protein FliT [Massilia oculi]
MLSPDQILLHYQAMGELSTRMLAAAQADDWDGVAELERECAAHVQTLRDKDPGVEWSGPHRARKAELIRQILADDRVIRDLAAPWMAKLSALISSSRVQSRLTSAYGGV